jgi:hypothetical protein
MKRKDDGMTMGLDRFNALLSWWGFPAANGNGSLEGQMQRIQAFAFDLQKAYGEAVSHQMEPLLKVNGQLAGSLPEFFRSRQPQDIMAAQLHVLATILDGASLQAKTWTELAQKVDERCAVLARETAAELHEQAREVAAANPPAEAHRPVTKEASRRAVHA